MTIRSGGTNTLDRRIRLILGKGEDRRVRAGHLWIFSNEVARIEPVGSDHPLFVDVFASSGRYLGSAIYNAHTLLAARLLDDGDWKEFKAYLEKKITASIGRACRKFTSENNARRLVHSEGDGLPGLVVDRFDEWLSVQITTLAMETYRDEILDILERECAPKGIKVENRLSARRTEGLEAEEDLLLGDIPDTLSVTISGNRLSFPFREGQKTGLFLDQTENVARLAPLFSGMEVLDAFCYTGNWSVAALKAGASCVSGLDVSEECLAYYLRNVRDTGPELKSEAIRADFMDWSPGARKAGRLFDAVVLDPPSFIKSRKKKEEGIKGYFAANEMGLGLVRPGGIFVTCSCSGLLAWEDFFGILRDVFRRAGRVPRLIYQGRAGMDHPRPISMPELDYLKCVAFLV